MKKENLFRTIIENKRLVVAKDRQAETPAQLKKMIASLRMPVKISRAVMRGSGIIAEIKRRSPNRDFPDFDVRTVAGEYGRNGACAVSVLTDEKFFGGSVSDIAVIKKASGLPVLRKDFIIDEYQIYQARAYGADAVLLIASILKPDELRHFSALAARLGMETLVEVHTAAELKMVLKLRNNGMSVNMVGINNRNLKTLGIDLQTSRDLLPLLPEDIVKIIESGIESRSRVREFRALGADGFLIGTALLKSKSPGAKLKSLQL